MQGLGLAIGATLMDLKKATTLASVTVMTFMLAGGFFVKVSMKLIRNSNIVFRIIKDSVSSEIVSLANHKLILFYTSLKSSAA